MECYKCKQPIRLQKVQHEGRLFHNGCFACGACNRSLKGVREKIFEVQGKFYDQTCYEQVQEDICAKCGAVIRDGGLVHSGNVYHDECFVCHKCKMSLSGKRFHKEDGVFYDADCYNNLNALMCDQCREIIEGVDIKYISYHGKFIHHKCFVCSSCRKQLSTAQKFRDVKTTVKGALVCLPCSEKTNPRVKADPTLPVRNHVNLLHVGIDAGPPVNVKREEEEISK